MKSPILKTCEVCGTEFVTKRSHYNKRRTCSRKCLGVLFQTKLVGEKNPNFKNKRFYKICQVCGKEFSYFGEKKRNCCSIACMGKWRSIVFVGSKNPAWRGGYDRYYGENWTYAKDLARQRDKYTCQHCGVTEQQLGNQLDVHHKKPFYLHSDYIAANKLDNLISLCKRCHRIAERKSREQYGAPPYRKKLTIGDRFVTVDKAAEIVGITTFTLYHHIAKGHIKAKNIAEEIAGRTRPRYIISRDDLDAFIASRR